MERVIKTRVKDGAPQVTTNVTIDFETFSNEDILELAAKSLVIEAQGEWRKDGNIPTSATITASEFGPSAPRAKRGPVDQKAVAAKFLSTPEGKAWLAANMPE